MSKSGIFFILLFINLSLLSVTHAGTAIYKHVDRDGNITFTNRPIKGGQKIQTASRAPASQKYSSKTVKHFPRESTGLRNKSRIKRREILEHELAAEIKLFSDTRKNLSMLRGNNTSHQQKENIRQLQSKLLRHENNITALNKELAKL